MELLTSSWNAAGNELWSYCFFCTIILAVDIAIRVIVNFRPLQGDNNIRKREAWFSTICVGGDLCLLAVASVYTVSVSKNVSSPTLLNWIVLFMFFLLVIGILQAFSRPDRSTGIWWNRQAWLGIWGPNLVGLLAFALGTILAGGAK